MIIYSDGAIWEVPDDTIVYVHEDDAPEIDPSAPPDWLEDK